MKRRNFLEKGTYACLAVGLTGCALFDDKEMKLGDIHQLESKDSSLFTFNGNDIMVTKLEGKWVVFSLICQHKKCTVKFHKDEQKFICPCHNGMYDMHGKVISGPPPRPLKRYKYEVRGSDLWVQNEWDDQEV